MDDDETLRVVEGEPRYPDKLVVSASQTGAGLYQDCLGAYSLKTDQPSRAYGRPVWRKALGNGQERFLYFDGRKRSNSDQVYWISLYPRPALDHPVLPDEHVQEISCSDPVQAAGSG